MDNGDLWRYVEDTECGLCELETSILELTNFLTEHLNLAELHAKDIVYQICSAVEVSTNFERTLYGA